MRLRSSQKESLHEQRMHCRACLPADGRTFSYTLSAIPSHAQTLFACDYLTLDLFRNESPQTQKKVGLGLGPGARPFSGLRASGCIVLACTSPFMPTAARGGILPCRRGRTLRDEFGVSVVKCFKISGHQTNNFAEYEAVILAFEALVELVPLIEHGCNKVAVKLDSELVVKQMNGLCKVRNPTLREQKARLAQVASAFGTVSFTHVPREWKTATPTPSPTPPWTVAHNHMYHTTPYS